MKKLINKSLIVLCIALLAFTYSCSKSSSSIEPDSNKNIRVTACISSYYTDHPSHMISTRFSLQNKSTLTLYYCKVKIIFYDDHRIVYTGIFEVGNKTNHDWTLSSGEVKWTDSYSTDFYQFGEKSYDAEVLETRFF